MGGGFANEVRSELRERRWVVSSDILSSRHILAILAIDRLRRAGPRRQQATRAVNNVNEDGWIGCAEPGPEDSKQRAQ